MKDEIPNNTNPSKNQNDEPIDNQHHEQEDGENFAELFESYSAGMNEDIQVGDKIRGKIISIGDSTVFVDTGTKADGLVGKEELKDENGDLPYEIGDELELYVVAADESEIQLSRAIAGIGGINMLQDAHKNAIPVEGKVLQTIKGGFQVEVLKRRAFCPISQIDTAYVEAPEDYVGKTYSFLIKRLTENGRNIVLSRRDLLEDEQRKVRQAFMRTLEIDQVFTGRVTRLMPFGAFVELAPGVEGMVHISELSWSRLDTPEAAVKPGDMIEVKVLRIEPGEKQQRIALSAKQVLGNPWDRLQDGPVGQGFSAGQKVSGKVTRCAPFGVFVELTPGVEGLVHISEMSYTQRVLKPEDMVSLGQTLSVMIKEIDLKKRRISLSMRDAQGDPWLDVEGKYTPGQAVNGTVENREGFGLFVALEPGIVGLLPKSEINKSANSAKIDTLKRGDAIAVSIDSIRLSERKISLKLRDSQDEGNWRQFTDQKSDSGNLGALGEKLAQALNKQKK
jgi:small subunit ribosomal protein S1